MTDIKKLLEKTKDQIQSVRWSLDKVEMRYSKAANIDDELVKIRKNIDTYLETLELESKESNNDNSFLPQEVL